MIYWNNVIILKTCFPKKNVQLDKVDERLKSDNLFWEFFLSLITSKKTKKREKDNFKNNTKAFKP